tara:strand:- start:5732 stop:6013 length:282 start_codon:yes stop_codon:yes gene_type:complete
MKYICTKCKETMELSKMTVGVVNNKVVTKEALCSCGEYMEEEDKSFKGFPIAGMTPEAQRVREVGWDDYYGTDNYSGYREKEQSEINKKYKKK